MGNYISNFYSTVGSCFAQVCEIFTGPNEQVQNDTANNHAKQSILLKVIGKISTIALSKVCVLACTEAVLDLAEHLLKFYDLDIRTYTYLLGIQIEADQINVIIKLAQFWILNNWLQGTFDPTLPLDQQFSVLSSLIVKELTLDRINQRFFCSSEGWFCDAL